MSTTSTTPTKVIDSHLHVWASAEEAASGFPYASGQEPPESLRSLASTSELLKRMDATGVDGALIVQPINHKFDHSYVLQAMKSHPTRFKGMLLLDPSLSPEEAVSRLEDLALQGMVGVRFNPYLWPKEGDDKKWTPMSTPGGAGLAVYKRCAELKLAVGVMCFQGLSLHYPDILQLIQESPDTMLILDHFGFTGLDEEGNAAFQKLLELAKYPNVIIKISALFRLKDPSPYEKVQKERLVPLLETFGAERLMFGTDFPFVLEQPESYDGMVQLTSSWLADPKDKQAVMGGTAERVFGHWGAPMVSPSNEL
ncbi:Amidohydrolase [Seminavis robusta]|uniref:Amidohydrolase n=1 Tax=Seminavis robusta TaxID=568900 RepID=A0A9N8DUS7_9STRA|nr:Amidohydrolase [Seminavis robusta]|eukprot:Sro263_g102390.1 Amidohydrolase (311) ;mRNA; r:76798-77730